MRILIAFIMTLLAASANANNVCQAVAGASVIANDGTYLGEIASEYAADSIFNEHGTYGSPYNAKSIWNEHGQYGSEFSALSAFNPHTSTPPVLVLNGNAIAHLTVNKYVQSPVNPYLLKSCTFY
jgi:hypothetical protein